VVPLSSTNSSYTAMPTTPDQWLAKLGFRSVQPQQLVNNISQMFGNVLGDVFAWTYFLSELTALVGVLVWLVGIIGHHPRVKQVGRHMILYSVIAFLAALLVPGLFISFYKHFHN
jgi:hypothetical protein